MQHFKQRSPLLQTRKRGTKKSGSNDEDSPWAKARLAQCCQLQEQFRLGAARGRAGVIRRGGRGEAFPPLSTNQIAFWDESHFKIRLGHGSKYEVLVCRDPATGRPCSPENGGVWPEAKPTTTTKFPGEARLLLGVAQVTPLEAGGVAPEDEGGKQRPAFLSLRASPSLDARRAGDQRRRPIQF